MSTRSGKRLHNSYNGIVDISEALIEMKSKRKTRSKRLKENECQIDVPISKSKKRENYVSFPVELDAGVDTEVPVTKTGRRPRGNTLKDHNIVPLTIDIDLKAQRLTRRTKKLESDAVPQPEMTNGKIKSKKSKKKRSKTLDEVTSVAVKEFLPVPKKKNKKKNKCSSDSFTVVNKSNTSMESFHSAAGSPLANVETLQDKDSSESNFTKLVNITTDTQSRKPESGTKKKKKRVKVSETQNEEINKTTDAKNISVQHSTIDKGELDDKSNASNGSFDKIGENRQSIVMNSTFDKNSDSNSTFDIEKNGSKKSSINNGTFDKPNDKRLSAVLNSTFDKNHSTNVSVQLNTTFDMESSRSTRSTDSGKINSSQKGSIEEKNSKANSLEPTFDKESKLDITFDKDTNSIKSSDSAINITYDKDSISITSDESKTENIVNITPVLIESSLDESNTSRANTSQNNEVKATLCVNLTTPLKREGTFTKEEVPKSPEKLPDVQTPPKDEELPAAGCTPFHRRSVPRQRSLMNITKSLEKPSQVRRSSMMEAPRQTKVMFCSPDNNPMVVQQQKRKVIKSSLKGSNKSFVFEEKEAVRSSRKRSLTAPDSEPAGAKRSRLASGLQVSVDRLSRPRTSSASAKLGETTPAPESPRPGPAPSRTKLPNFAALHQKQFERMESLGDCKRRHALRARRMLTPSGGVNVLDRSPKVTAEAPKPQKPVKEVAKKPEPAPKSTAKPAEPAKTYTRFGFKLNIDVNPFSVPSKVAPKLQDNKEVNKPNGIVRQTSHPSLTGATCVRKDVAKQVIMREKSFTSLSNRRDVSRKENRTVIKGVRTNRRFELQMQMRNV